MKKVLKESLEKCRDEIVKTIHQAMQAHPPTNKEVCWLLLEYTLEHPFPPTLGLAQTEELEKEIYKEENPLLCYNAPDLELFSESGTIQIDFKDSDNLFENTHNLLSEIEYDDREPIVFKIYVDICKSLMSDKTTWQKMKIAKDFHVTARDYESCNEENYLKKTLAKPALKKLLRKIESYNQTQQDDLENDETIQTVKRIMNVEAKKYDLILSESEKIDCEDVYTREEMYFLCPYHFEMTYHKSPKKVMISLSTHPPKDGQYYHYKIKGRLPYVVSFYSDNQIIWKTFYKRTDEFISEHKFFLKSGTPEIESFYTLSLFEESPMVYREYTSHQLTEIIYQGDESGKIKNANCYDKRFGHGYKSETQFKYLFEYKNEDLFKITTENQNGKKSVQFCEDDSFMIEAIEEYIDYLSHGVIQLMKKEGVDYKNANAIVLEYEDRMPFYFTLYLLFGNQLVDITTYELYENDNPMLNMMVYTTPSSTSRLQDYLPIEKSHQYIKMTHSEICEELPKKIEDDLGITFKVIFKSRYKDLDLK